MSNAKNDPRMADIKKQLDQISAAAKDLRDNGYTALDQATGAAAKGVADAQKKAVSELDQLKNDKSKLRGENADGWQGVKDDFHNFFAKSRVKHDENEIARDIKKAIDQADKSADNADNALDHAIDALKAAQVAVLDAIEAAYYADELNADLTA